MILLLVAVALKSTAQELNCKFTVNYSQIQGTSTQVFTTLENALMEFINTRRWTQAQYEVNERIRCSMNLTVKEYNEADGRWKCELIVQSTRPVWQSGYQTVVFSFKDTDVAFNYREFDPLQLRDWTAGIGSSLRWKNFSFGFLIDVRYGGDVYLQSMMRLQSNGQTKETVAGREEFYSTGKGLISQGVNVNTGAPNTVELNPTAYWGQFYGNIGNYVYDATNVRLRELNFSWILPDKWFNKTIISGIKVSAVANNVCFLYNNLPGFDPECTYSTGNGQGVETAALPSTRSFGFNLNVTF